MLLPRLRPEDEKDWFRLLLLSSVDLKSPTTSMARIERLYHQNGGKHVGIVFLLNEKSPSRNGTIALMELQARYSHCPIVFKDSH